MGAAVKAPGFGDLRRIRAVLVRAGAFTHSIIVYDIAGSNGRDTHGLVESRDSKMKLRIDYELQYEFPQPTPAILMLNIHLTRVSDLTTP
jgi:hypothetical protein